MEYYLQYGTGSLPWDFTSTPVAFREKQEQANAARLKFTSRDGDHLTLLNVLRAYLEVPRKDKGQWCSDNFVNIRSLGKAQDIFEQLQRHMEQLGLPCKSCGSNYDVVRRALITGLFQHAARFEADGTYKVRAGDPGEGGSGYVPSPALRLPGCVTLCMGCNKESGFW